VTSSSKLTSGSIGFQEANDTSTDVGLDVRLGGAFLIETNWSAFIEYRFTHVSPTFDTKVFGGSVPASTTFDTPSAWATAFRDMGGPSRETRDAPR
jgi:hypothetical protein